MKRRSAQPALRFGACATSRSRRAATARRWASSVWWRPTGALGPKPRPRRAGAGPGPAPWRALAEAAAAGPTRPIGRRRARVAAAAAGTPPCTRAWWRAPSRQRIRTAALLAVAPPADVGPFLPDGAAPASVATLLSSISAAAASLLGLAAVPFWDARHGGAAQRCPARRPRGCTPSTRRVRVRGQGRAPRRRRGGRWRGRHGGRRGAGRRAACRRAESAG
jgi:hypothetical protein